MGEISTRVQPMLSSRLQSPVPEPGPGVKHLVITGCSAKVGPLNFTAITFCTESTVSTDSSAYSQTVFNSIYKRVILAIYHIYKRVILAIY